MEIYYLLKVRLEIYNLSIVCSVNREAIDTRQEFTREFESLL